MDVRLLATIVLIGGFFVLMMLRVPITFALLIATLGSALVSGTNLSVMVNQMVQGANSFSLLAIPFFILMGEIMAEGGMSEKIVDLANVAVGRFRGGLAYVNVIDSMFFGGISGSAVADVSSLGSIVIPMMKKQGYKPEFAVGLTGDGLPGRADPAQPQHGHLCVGGGRQCHGWQYVDRRPAARHRAGPWFDDLVLFHGQPLQLPGWHGGKLQRQGGKDFAQCPCTDVDLRYHHGRRGCRHFYGN
jgi:hypothetical protein